MSTEKTIINELTRAERDAQKIRQLEGQIKGLQINIREYVNAERVLIAAGIVSQEKIDQAHDIVRGFAPSAGATHGE